MESKSNIMMNFVGPNETGQSNNSTNGNGPQSTPSGILKVFYHSKTYSAKLTLFFYSYFGHEAPDLI